MEPVNGTFDQAGIALEAGRDAAHADKAAGLRFVEQAARPRAHAVDVHKLVGQIDLPLPHLVAAVGRAQCHAERTGADALIQLAAQCHSAKVWL
jgi:hypothetical protein